MSLVRSRNMRSLTFALAVAAGVFAFTPAADARNVYLNGVKLDVNVALKPQTFTGCEVRVDEKGDLHITAKGYKLVAPPAGTSPAPATPAVTAAADPDRRYWLISKFDDRAAAGFDVEIFINNAMVKKVRSGDDPLVLDVSRHLNPGDNLVTMVATKSRTATRAARSPDEKLEVILGEGKASGGTVTIDKVHATFRRTANEAGPIREDFRVPGPAAGGS